VEPCPGVVSGMGLDLRQQGRRYTHLTDRNSVKPAAATPPSSAARCPSTAGTGIAP
jgi:hypothetical protein